MTTLNNSVEEIVARTAYQGVFTLAAIQHVLAAFPLQCVVAGFAKDQVLLRGTYEGGIGIVVGAPKITSCLVFTDLNMIWGDHGSCVVTIEMLEQLIGSLKPHPATVRFGQVPAGMGTPVAGMAAPGAPNSGFGSVLGQAMGQVGGLNPQGPGSQSASSSSPGTTSTNGPAATGNPVSADQGTGAATGTAEGTDADAPIPTDDTSPIIGGNIIGVGSKVDKKSVIVYDHAKNYRLFEFIWDPSKDTFGIGQPGMQTGTGLGQPIGQPIGQPAGQSPSNPQNPQNPPQPQQNPQQQ